MRCGHAWEGYRVIHFDRHGNSDHVNGSPNRYDDAPLRGGMTECEKCRSIYVEWVNHVEVLKILRAQGRIK